MKQSGIHSGVHETVAMDEAHGAIQISDSATLGPFTVVSGPVEIGDNSEIGPHVILGARPADAYRDIDPRAGVLIGDNVVIHEFSAIQKPLASKATVIGSNCYLMQGANISHDSHLHDGVILSAGCHLGGYVQVLENANLGMGVVVHQRSVIGAWCMIAAGAAVVRDIRPFTKYIPGKPLSVNSAAFKRLGWLDHHDFDQINSQITAWVTEGVSPTHPVIQEYATYYASARSRHRRPELSTHT